MYRSHRDTWGASNLPTSHAKPPVQRDTQCPPPPPPPTPQPTNRPVKERWVLNNSTTGSRTTSGDKRSERAHPSDKILSGRFNSGRVFKTSRVVCQVCKRWFRSRFDLATHQRSICAPATKTLGFQNLYQPPSLDMARLTNLPIIPRHPTLFQKANVLRHNPALTPCNMDNSVARRYSVPGETRHL